MGRPVPAGRPPRSGAAVSAGSSSGVPTPGRATPRSGRPPPQVSSQTQPCARPHCAAGMTQDLTVIAMEGTYGGRRFRERLRPLRRAQRQAHDDCTDIPGVRCWQRWGSSEGADASGGLGEPRALGRRRLRKHVLEPVHQPACPECWDQGDGGRHRAERRPVESGRGRAARRRVTRQGSGPRSRGRTLESQLECTDVAAAPLGSPHPALIAIRAEGGASVEGGAALADPHRLGLARR